MARIPKNLALDPDVVALIDAAPEKGAYVDAAVRAYASGGAWVLDPDVRELLTGVEDPSAYVSAVLRQRAQTWRSAFAFLRASGWTVEALRAACDVLNGYWPEEGRPATWIAHELADADRLSGVAAKHDVPPELWATLVHRIAEGEIEARAVLELAREFWAGNTAVDRVLYGERE